MSSPTNDKIKGERGGFLSQSQYHSIANFLRTGELPLIDETNDSSQKTNSSNSDNLSPSKSTPTQQHGFENMRQFRGWARRMFLEDGILKHKVSGKIILPKDMFVQIIKEMHSGSPVDGSSKTSRHLGVKRTIEKIQSIYTMGKRSFGMNEELVKTVVKNCRSGSCQKHKFKKKFKIDAMKFRKLNQGQDSPRLENKVSSPLKWKNKSVKHLIKNLNAKKSTALSTASSSKANFLKKASPFVAKPSPSNTEPSRKIDQNENKPFPLSVIKYTPQGIVCEPINVTSDSQKTQNFSFILPTSTQQALTSFGITNNVFNFPNVKPLLVTNASNQSCQSTATVVQGNSNQTTSLSSTTNKVPILSNSAVLNTSESNNVMFCVIPTNVSSSLPLVKTASGTAIDVNKLSTSMPVAKTVSGTALDVDTHSTSLSMAKTASGTAIDLNSCSSQMLGSSSNFRGLKIVTSQANSNPSTKTDGNESKITLSGMKKKLRAKIKNASTKRKFATITKQDACRNLTDALNNCSKNILKQNKKFTDNTTTTMSSGCKKTDQTKPGIHTIEKKLKIKQIPGINDIVLIEFEDETEKLSPTGQTEQNSTVCEEVKNNTESDGDVIMLDSPEINTHRKYEIKIPLVPRPGPLPHPSMWYYSKDLAQQTNCYTSLLMSIHDLKIDITKSYLRDLSAVERVKRKLCYLETLTKKIKTFTERCKNVDFDIYMDTV